MGEIARPATQSGPEGGKNALFEIRFGERGSCPEVSRSKTKAGYMILDLPRFIDAERPYWNELDTLLSKREADPYLRLSFEKITRLQYLYARCSSALAHLSTFSAEPQTREYLESLVARAYAECHSNRARTEPFRPIYWLRETFPQTFRKHLLAFWLS